MGAAIKPRRQPINIDRRSYREVLEGIVKLSQKIVHLCSQWFSQKSGSYSAVSSEFVIAGMIFHIPPNLVVGRCRRTLIASGSEDLQVEHPVCGRQSSAFHFHPTLARVQGPALVRDQVVQVREAGEKRRLTSTEMMEALHHERFPVDGVVGLV